MKLNGSLFLLSILSPIVFCQDDELPLPGNPALPYSDGVFNEPRGNTPTYEVDASMNVSWSTNYEGSNLYLIVGYAFNEPVQLATNTAQTWFQWTVSAESKNESEIYLFRVVDAAGSPEDQQGGGFLSASFYINGQNSTPTPDGAKISTSASAPAQPQTSSAAESTPTNTLNLEPQSGLSDSAKIGVGVGVGVGVLGLAALGAGIWFWRRSRRGGQKTSGPSEMSYEPYSRGPSTFGGSPHPAYASTQPPYGSTHSGYVDPNAPGHTENKALAGYYRPAAEMPADSQQPSAELDGASHVVEAPSDNVRRHPPTELQ